MGTFPKYDRHAKTANDIYIMNAVTFSTNLSPNFMKCLLGMAGNADVGITGHLRIQYFQGA